MKKIYPLLLLLCFAPLVQAQIKLEFNEVAQSADLIFVGTVENQESYWNDQKTMILTDVTFKDISIVAATAESKQKNRDAIKLTFAGGAVGDRSVSVSGSPNFGQANKYLIFSKDDGKIYANPIIGGNQGKFGIIQDTEDKIEYVINSSGKILLKAEPDNLVYSTQKIERVKNENIIFKTSFDDGFNDVAPFSSNTKSKVELVDFSKNEAINGLKPTSLQTFENYITTTALINPVQNRQLIVNSNDTGFIYKKDKSGEIVKEKIISTAQSNAAPEANSMIFSADQNSSVEKNKNFQSGANGSASSAGGTLGACGYQTLPIVMQQVPTDFWQYNIYNNNMWDWNQFMDVYMYIPTDGTYGFYNNTNEFANFVSEASLNTVYGVSWNGYLAYCIVWGGGNNCTEIYETDVMYNPAYSWTDDPDYAIENDGIWLLQPIMMHELGHTWGEQMGIYTETYDYDVLTVMQGGYQDIYETGRGIHRSDAYLFRQQYSNQTPIKSTVDVGIESYYANNGLHESFTNNSTFYPGDLISLYNMTAENMSYNAVSDVRVRFYLSSNRIISTSDYQIGGNDSYLYWSSFSGEGYSVFSYSDYIPSDIPAGNYYIGMIISVNGFNDDDFLENNTTSFTYPITILNQSFYISTSANPSNGGIILGGGSYNNGQTASLYAIADDGYYFDSWTENGALVSTHPIYDFTVSGDRTLVANFQMQSFTISASANQNNTGTVSGAGAYNYGQTANLVATPETGYSFENWVEMDPVVLSITTDEYPQEISWELIDSLGTILHAGNNYSNANSTYIEKFWLPSGNYTFTIEDSYGDGICCINGNGSYTLTDNIGTEIASGGDYGSLETTTFSVVETGTIISEEQNLSFTVFEDKMLIANFQLQSHIISASANVSNGGTVIGAGNYDYGQTANLSATTETGYDFINWTENGTEVSTNPNYSFTVTEDRMLVANFQIQSYMISASSNSSNGGITSGAGTYDHGQTADLIAMAQTGFIFINWTENGTEVSTNPNYSFTVTENRTLVANFQVQSYTISTSVNSNSGGIVTGAGTYNFGQTANLIATAETGYDFINWTENGTEVSTNPNYNFTVTEDKTLVANFQVQSYTISTSANSNDGGIISGAGTYDHGQTADLIATAQTGFTFINWTENGAEVSNNPFYSFTVTENRTLTANFDAVTSIATLENTVSFDLYPNPTRGLINIKYTDNAIAHQSDVLLYLIDNMGRKIALDVLSFNGNKIQSNIGDNKSGIYYLQLIVNKELVQTFKVILMD